MRFTVSSWIGHGSHICIRIYSSPSICDVGICYGNFQNICFTTTYWIKFLKLFDFSADGLPDNMATYGLISGMWTSVLSIGMFVGPTLGGGLLFEYLGYAWATVVFFGLGVLLVRYPIFFIIFNNTI